MPIHNATSIQFQKQLPDGTWADLNPFIRPQLSKAEERRQERRFKRQIREATSKPFTFAVNWAPNPLPTYRTISGPYQQMGFAFFGWRGCPPLVCKAPLAASWRGARSAAIPRSTAIAVIAQMLIEKKENAHA